MSSEAKQRKNVKLKMWGIGLAVVAASLAQVAPANAVVKTKLLMFGDSLTQEANHSITTPFKSNASYTIAVHPQTGAAPCDFLPGITKALNGSSHYRLLAIETAGNSQSKCMRVPGSCSRCYLPIGSPEWEARYRADLNAIVDLADSKGTQVLFLSPPPMADIGIARNDVDTTVEPTLAVDHPEVVFTDGPRQSVSDAGGNYTPTLPCLASETAADGCTAGVIPIRAPDGTHFCPTGFVTVCPEYSSGAYRFGTATASAIEALLP